MASGVPWRVLLLPLQLQRFGGLYAAALVWYPAGRGLLCGEKVHEDVSTTSQDRSETAGSQCGVSDQGVRSVHGIPEAEEQDQAKVVSLAHAVILRTVEE